MNGTTAGPYDAILLLGFGGPDSPEAVRPFIDRVLEGRRIPPARYEQVVENYVRIGGKSPYNERTQQQAKAISVALAERGIQTPVHIAYRNTAPFVDDVVARLTGDGARNVLAIVLAPHEGAAGRDKYVQVAEEARRRSGQRAPKIEYVDTYFDHPLFVGAHADRIRDAQTRFGVSNFEGIELIFTAHSIPKTTPGVDLYVRQLTQTADAIARALGVPHWSLAYQSRSGAPTDPWLEPDVRDILRGLPEKGVRNAIVDPIGFLCDHVEVLYDLDIDAKAVATQSGVRLERAVTLNDHPLFIQMLAELSIASMQRHAAGTTEQ